MPRLETERLILRPPEYGDVPALAALAGDYDVAKNLASVPHPYGEADARAFVTKAHDKRAKGEGWCFAVLRKPDESLVGCCGLHLKDGRYELGYWIGKPFWNQGYATEAARRLAAFAFHDLKADGIWAGWFADNPASGRVLEKLGAKPDGSAPRACLARGRDLVCRHMTLTRADFGRKKAPAVRSAPACLETR